jgi:hypothetical protein
MHVSHKMDQYATQGACKGTAPPQANTMYKHDVHNKCFGDGRETMSPSDPDTVGIGYQDRRLLPSCKMLGELPVVGLPVRCGGRARILFDQSQCAAASSITTSVEHATDMGWWIRLCRCVNSIGDSSVNVNKAGRALSLKGTIGLGT